MQLTEQGCWREMPKSPSALEIDDNSSRQAQKDERGVISTRGMELTAEEGDQPVF